MLEFYVKKTKSKGGVEYCYLYALNEDGYELKVSYEEKVICDLLDVAPSFVRKLKLDEPILVFVAEVKGE